MEAARAGDAGKGFAVVADEVRNLASKSAQAAQNTASLIEASIIAVQDGSKIVSETAQSLETVVSEMRVVADFVLQISDSASAQDKSIHEITSLTNNISSITTQNTSMATMSTQATQNLSQQAQNLDQVISQFTSATR